MSDFCWGNPKAGVEKPGPSRCELRRRQVVQSAVRHRGTHRGHAVSTSRRPTHSPAFGHPRVGDLGDRAFGARARDRSPGPGVGAVVDEGVGADPIFGRRQHLWATATFETDRKPRRSARVVGTQGSAMAYSPDGRTLAIGRDDGGVALWDPQVAIEVALFTAVEKNNSAPFVSIKVSIDAGKAEPLTPKRCPASISRLRIMNVSLLAAGLRRQMKVSTPGTLAWQPPTY